MLMLAQVHTFLKCRITHQHKSDDAAIRAVSSSRLDNDIGDPFISFASAERERLRLPLTIRGRADGRRDSALEKPNIGLNRWEPAGSGGMAGTTPAIAGLVPATTTASARKRARSACMDQRPVAKG
ncbi:MAG: hypothetical protein HC900_09915 [Methylacidiphilales bacterium]|nr:hypothetical protein [Candidatus Methylacidiphilales bacterium]